MHDRRKFIKEAASVTLASYFFPQILKGSKFYNSPLKRNIGLQLYTLSNLMNEDARGTLEKVSKIGYKELEGAATSKGYYYGYSPKELAKIINDLGMHWRSQHVMGAPFRIPAPNNHMTSADSLRAHQMAERFKSMKALPNLTNDYNQLADEAAEGGLSYLVCASIPVKTLDDFKIAADVFNKAGEACKKSGVQFAYHNHTTEFDKIDGQSAFEYILSNTDKDLVKMELDLAWATKAGQDPVTLFNLHKERFPLWHVKDLDKTSQNPTEVGSGYINFKRIFEHADTSGLKYFFVEQDGAPHPIENITVSFNNLKKIEA